MTASRGELVQGGNGAQWAGVGRRVRRALFFAGNAGLMLGATLGLLRIHPELLSPWLPVTASELGITLVGGAIIGLVTGAVTGLALRGSKGMLRYSAAAFVVMASLMSSEVVRAVGLRLPLRATLIGEVGDVLAAQIGLALLGALVGVQTGRVHVRLSGAASQAPAAHPRRRETNRRAGRRANGQPRSRPAVAAASSGANASHGVQLVTPKPAPKPFFKKRRFRRGVQLGREKMSICPYCLEEVKPHDPRGRVVCKICGTPHHGDCWAITGKCEVPHLQT